jgi:hypothetical protein
MEVARRRPPLYLTQAMRLSKDLQRKLKTILWITVAWTLISMLQLSYDYAVTMEYGFEYRWSTLISNSYERCSGM